MIENDRLPVKFIQRWGVNERITVSTHIAPTLIVGDDQQNVRWLLLCMASAYGGAK